MGDQAALQEAIQRARQLAAKISQNAPVKRPASELEDHTVGTVKVTLAYEKPAGTAAANNNNSSNDNRSSSDADRRSSSIHRDSSHMRANSRDGDDRGGSRRGGDRRVDRDSIYFGSNNGDNNNNAYSRSGRDGSNPPSSLGGGSSQYSMLGGHLGGGGGTADDRIEIIIPHAVIGLVIGKGGENIKRIQNETGATVRVDPNTVDEKGNKVCTITGTKQAVEEAHNQVASVIENAATNKRPRMQVEGSEQYRMKIPASRTGAIIGKGGETIKSIKAQSGCDIELDKGAKECGPEESVFIIRGTQDKILKARALIEARLASRGRDGGDRDSQHHHHRSSSGPKGVATGANAAPVAPYTDLPAAAAGGPQSSAEVQAAWAAYVAQYSNHLFNQPTGATAAPAGMPGYPGQNTGLGGTMGAAAQAVMMPQPVTQIPQATQAAPAAAAAASATGQAAADFSNQWIEFYIAMGRPDYAQQVVELKKKQQQELLEQQQQQQQNNDNINDQNEH